jgi:hypothetical protein
LPAIGIIYSIVLIFAFREGARQVIRLYDLVRKLEEEPEFDNLKKRGARLFSDIGGLHPGRAHIWKLGTHLTQVFPLIFIAVWITLIFTVL